MERNGYSVKPVNYYVKLTDNINPLDLTNKLNSSLKIYQKIHDRVELQPISKIYLHSDDIQDAEYTKKRKYKTNIAISFNSNTDIGTIYI